MQPLRRPISAMESWCDHHRAFIIFLRLRLSMRLGARECSLRRRCKFKQLRQLHHGSERNSSCRAEFLIAGTAAETEHSHTSRHTCLYSGNTVFNYRACMGRDAHGTGSVEEEAWIGLPDTDFISAENGLREPW